MRNAYADNGIHINRRIFETVARPMVNKAKVSDPGEAEILHGLHEGDEVDIPQLETWNKTLKHKIKYEPMIMGIGRVPFLADDFIQPLMFQRLPRTLGNAPALGQKTDVISGNIIPSIVYNNMTERAQAFKNAPGPINDKIKHK